MERTDTKSANKPSNRSSVSSKPRSASSASTFAVSVNVANEWRLIALAYNCRRLARLQRA